MIFIKWFIRITKYTLLTVSVILISVLLLMSLLLFTHIGNQVIIKLVTQFESRFSIELIEGTLFNSPRYQNISWVDGKTVIKVSSADYQFDWSCLSSGICLNKLNIDGAQILIAEANETGKVSIEVKSDATVVDIDIPIEVIIKQLNLTQINVVMGEFSIDLDALSLQAHALQKDISLSSQIKGLLITLPSSIEPAAIQKTQPNSTTVKNRIDLSLASLPAILSAEMFPNITSPINLTVQPINIDKLKIVQNRAILFELNSLQSAFTFKETQLSISQFLLDIPETKLSLNATIDFVDDYPLDISVDGQLKKIKQLQPTTLLSDLHFKLNSQGSLSNLNSELQLSNKINLQLRSHLDLFSDNLPHKIALEWQNFQWPLTGEAQYKSQQGSFSSEGSMLDNQINLLADYVLGDFPAGKVNLTTKGDLQKLQIENLTVETLSGQVDFSGLLTWQDDINWLGQLQITNIDLQQLDSEYDGQFSGIIKQQASVILFENSPPEWHFDFPELNINGELLARPLSITGRVSGNDKQGITFDKLAIKNAQNAFVVNGLLATENDLTIALDVQDISHTFIDVKGKIKGDINLKGPNSALQISSKLEIQQLAYQNYQLASMQLNSQLTLTEKPQLTLNLIANDIIVEQQQIDDIEIHISNTTINNSKSDYNHADKSHYRHQVDLVLSSDVISAELALHVTQTDNEILTQLDNATLHLPHQTLILATPFDVITQQNMISISPHCWQDRLDVVGQNGDQQAGELCIKALNIGELGNAIVNVDNYLLANFNPFLPENFKMAGALSANVDLSWYKNSKPTFKINIFSDDMQLKINSDSTSDVFIDYPMKKFTINAVSQKQQIDIDANIFADNLIDVKLKGQLFPYKNQPSINSLVNINLPDFSLFLPLIPQLEQLKGQLTSQLSIVGNLKKPDINGNVNIDNGQISYATLPMKITELQSVITIKKSTATLQGSFNSNDSNTIGERIADIPILTNTLNILDKSLKKVHESIIQKQLTTVDVTAKEEVSPGIAFIKGQLDWSNKLSGDIHLYAQKLVVYDYGKIDLLISPDIHLQVNEHININGNLLINKGKIVVKDLPAGAVSQSKDIVIIDVEKQDSSADLPIIIDLFVDMGERFQVVALGLDSFITGKLLIKKPLKSELSINGKLSFVEGSYRSLGQQLILQESSIRFSGPPESPYLTIEAIRDPNKVKNDVTAGVRVTGTPDALQLVIFSEPAMAQQEALSYITRGQSLGSTSGSSSTIANLLVDIATGQSGGLMSSIGEGIGIKDLSLSSSGTGDEQSVGVRGEIAPGIEVSYGVGVFDSFSILAIRYEMFERFYLEASSGIDQAVDVYYEWDWRQD